MFAVTKWRLGAGTGEKAWRFSLAVGAAALAAGVVLPSVGSAQESAEAGVIRFALSPDPVWDYLADTGELAKWEQKHNLKVEISSSWDEFAYFAGGHGDIVSMATYELPVLEERTGIDVVAFGKYNHLRTPVLARADKGYNKISDAPKGSTLCTMSSVGATIFWSTVASNLENVDFRVGEGDYETVVNEHIVNGELIARGDCELGPVVPDAAVARLRTGELKILYDGRAPWQVWQDICKCDHKGIMSNLFVARAEWYEAHKEEAAAFLELWERGIELWQQNKAEIVRKYPQHFAVEEQEDIEWTINCVSTADFFVDHVYLDQAWIDREVEFYDYMVKGGWLQPDYPKPDFVVVQPAG